MYSKTTRCGNITSSTNISNYSHNVLYYRDEYIQRGYISSAYGIPGIDWRRKSKLKLLL